jgi:hypothetical protein
MRILAHHKILVSGDSYQNCRNQVVDFFDRTQLVRYDRVRINTKESWPGSHQDFNHCVAEAIQNNRHILAGLAKELENTGVTTIADLLSMQQGYPSKVLHILTHFLDGFIGIDSIFYNLIDDSHWLPEQTQKAIVDAPDGYWLISVDCSSDTPEKASLIRQ